MLTQFFTGELLGTMTLIIFGGGVVANVLLKKSKGEGEAANWLTITTGWFIAVTIGVFIAQSAGAPNADINPAVTLAKYFLHMYSLKMLITIWCGQLIGAFIGACIVWLAYLPHWKITEDKVAKLCIFSTVPAIRNYPANLLNEIIGTTVLVVGVAAIFDHATLGHPALGIGPYMVGVLVWGIGLSLGGATGYAINPARDLGPRIAHAILPIGAKEKFDWGYAWVPIVGPLIGGCLGSLLWKIFLK